MFLRPRAFVCPLAFMPTELCSLSKVRVPKALIAPLAFAVITIAAFSQNTTTSMRGTVTDPQGAVVADAEVTLQDSATGVARSQKTSDRGEYQFLQIPPGTYSITTTAAGFVSSRKENAVLLVNTPATLNFALKVGAAGTIVDVSAEATTVNTVDATIGNPFDSKQILQLPSEGRNAVELLSLQAGVTYTGTKVDQASDSRGGAVNGARSDQSNITVDGLDNNDQLLGNAFSGVLRIPMDSLEEFRVTTTNANADSGRSSGAQVSLVTKSGTNQFHGTAYEYNRSSLGTANDWFNKRAQLQAGFPNKPGQLIRNTFGSAVGGPLIKDRLFFFANYEGQHSREAVQVTQAVPSVNLRHGVVSYINANGSLTTLQPSDIKSLDQGCLTSGSCPNGNGVSRTVLDLWNGKSSLPNGTPIPAYPLPNTGSAVGADGINIDGYTFAAPQPENQNTYLFKLDYNVTQNGNHRVFLRGNLQNDRELFAAQFPGEPPSHVFRTNSKGIASGYTAILSNTVINNFRYAFIREGTGDAGSNPYSYVGFWNLADQVSFARTTDVSVPLNQFVDDVTWMRGKHTLQFGGNGRVIDDNRASNQENFFYGSSHPDWLFNGGIANTGQNLDPAISSSFPAVDLGFGYTYDAAIADVTGLVGSISATYNQNKSGIFARTGSLIQRRFQSTEAELYAQDGWHVSPNLQLTFGLRYSLLQPPYETNGNQVASTPSLSAFFNHRAIAGEAGYGYQPPVSFALSGQANGKQPYWNWDYKDLSPRFAFAYSPDNDSGFLHKLFGAKGKSSIRGGYGLYFDHFGEAIVNTFDRQGSFGLSTFLENPAGVQTTDCVARFVSLTTIPATNGCPAGSGLPELPPQPAGGFPFTPPGAGANGSFAIAWGLDSALKTPYSHVVDFSITRELPHEFVLEVAYVGRFGRRLLQEVDMATPENLRDPKSGMTYFQAATALVKLANANTNESAVKPIPYWENLFPSAAGSAGESGYAPGTPASPTATQNIYDLYYANNPNATYALLSLDTTCFPACSTLGPYAYWDGQFSSLYSWRSTGSSNHNGLQTTLRRRVASLELDVNYTYSKSLDENSNAERVNEYEAGSNGGTAVSYSGQVVNAWMPHQLYGPSDFDLRHQFNANWVYDLPFGRGKRVGSKAGRVLDGILGGWEFSGLTRWTSGYPFSVDSYAFATDYEQDGRAVLLGAAPTTGTYIDSGGNPNVFKAGTGAISAFRFAYPGESGQRNNLRGPGYFGIDMSLAKLWRIGETQSIRFSCDAFNVTNSVRFDVGTIGNYLLYPQQLGEFTQTMTHPRVIQFGLRYSF